MKYRIPGLFAALIACTLTAALAVALPQARSGREAPPDTWGGAHVEMQVTAHGATLQFDCAEGEMQEAIKLDAAGSFTVHGNYTPERGGPVQKDHPPQALPAVYKGTIRGDSMQLEVILGANGPSLEPFTLTRGKTGHVVLCR